MLGGRGAALCPWAELKSNQDDGADPTSPLLFPHAMWQIIEWILQCLTVAFCRPCRRATQRRRTRDTEYVEAFEWIQNDLESWVKWDCMVLDVSVDIRLFTSSGLKKGLVASAPAPIPAPNPVLSGAQAPPPLPAAATFHGWEAGRFIVRGHGPPYLRSTSDGLHAYYGRPDVNVMSTSAEMGGKRGVRSVKKEGDVGGLAV